MKCQIEILCKSIVTTPFRCKLSMFTFHKVLVNKKERFNRCKCFKDDRAIFSPSQYALFSRFVSTRLFFFFVLLSPLIFITLINHKVQCEKKEGYRAYVEQDGRKRRTKRIEQTNMLYRRRPRPTLRQIVVVKQVKKRYNLTLYDRLFFVIENKIICWLCNYYYYYYL